MKKEYFTPEIEVFDFCPEQVLLSASGNAHGPQPEDGEGTEYFD